MEQTASIRTETGGQIEFRGGSPHAARKGKRPQGMKWKVVRPSPDRSSLGGRVISLLVKHAKDTDMTSQEMRQKYQQARACTQGI